VSAKVRRHGKVHELPEPVRKQVDMLLLEPGASYEDIAEYLKRQGHDIGKSSIGRYGKEYMAAYQRLRIVEDKSRALVSEAGGDGLVLEEAGSKLFAQIVIDALLAENVPIKKVGDLMFSFASLQKSSIAREKFKVDLKDKVLKTADAVTKIAQKGGLSDDAARQIREKILGIA
jgi:uncharacterized ubiquitin-like protein YukD